MRVTTPGGGEVRTKQADKLDCDINAIMRRYAASGVLGHSRNLDGVYGNFENAEDYHTHMTRIRAAEEHFMTLPAEVREACKNDPAVLVDIATNPERQGEFESLSSILGLEPPTPDPENPSEPVPPAAAEPPAEPPPGKNGGCIVPTLGYYYAD